MSMEKSGLNVNTVWCATTRKLVLAVFPARRTTSDDGEVDRKNGLKMRLI